MIYLWRLLHPTHLPGHLRFKHRHIIRAFRLLDVVMSYASEEARPQFACTSPRHCEWPYVEAARYSLLSACISRVRLLNEQDRHVNADVNAFLSRLQYIIRPFHPFLIPACDSCSPLSSLCDLAFASRDNYRHSR